MVSDRNDWGLLDVLDSFASGERAAHVWAGAAGLATIIRREARVPYGRQRLEQTLSSTRREELAALLRHACFRSLKRDTEQECYVTNRDAHGRLYDLGDELWAARERALLADPAMADEPHLHITAAAREARWRGPVSTQEIAIAALRISDDPQTSIYLANSEAFSGNADRALLIANRILAAGRVETAQAQAQLVRGFAYSLQERYWEALAAYREASNLGGFGATAAFYRLVMSVWVQSRNETVDAAFDFRDVVDGDAEVADLLATWNNAYSELKRVPGGVSWAGECRLEETMPEEAWRVIRAVLGGEV